MTQPNYQTPNEMRDFAEKSIEQASKAFETFAGAAQKAISSVEPVLPGGAKEVSGKTFSYSQANIKAAFDLAQKLVHAKDAQEFVQLQTDFVKAQAETIQEQAKELGIAVQKAMTSNPRDISS
jgi:phasin